MLPKGTRLTSPEVTQVLKRGRSRRGTFLSIKILAVPAGANPGKVKISAVVSKSVARQATERNRLRRAVYRALTSPLVQKLYTAGSFHAVVFVQKVPEQGLSKVFIEDLQALLKYTV